MDKLNYRACALPCQPIGSPIAHNAAMRLNSGEPSAVPTIFRAPKCTYRRPCVVPSLSVSGERSPLLVPIFPNSITTASYSFLTTITLATVACTVSSPSSCISLPAMDSSPYSSINDLVERRTIEDYDTFRCVQAHHPQHSLFANASLWWTVLSQFQAPRSSPNQCELSSSPDYSTSRNIPHVARKS